MNIGNILTFDMQTGTWKSYMCDHIHRLACQFGMIISFEKCVVFLLIKFPSAKVFNLSVIFLNYSNIKICNQL